MRRALAVGLFALLAGCGADPGDDESVAVSTATTATDAVTATVSLAPLRPNGSCGVPRQRRHDRSMHAVTDAMGIFRRGQHGRDAAATAEVQGVPAADIDFASTRAPSGLEERLILVPTHTVKETCDAGQTHEGPSGVCLIHGGAPEISSRCFDMRAVNEGRAAALLDAERAVGLVPDGIEQVIVEAGGERTRSSVVENVYVVRVTPSDGPVDARVTLVRESLDGCEPSAAMRNAAPLLDRPPEPSGVPEIVRRSVRFDVDSRIAAKYARIWGGADEITYWIVPHLRCEVAALEADTVCVTPVKASYSEASSACVEPAKTGWIHFPDGDVSAIAGFAPAHVREAVVRVDDETVVLPVSERVYAGRLEGIPLDGEVGRARVEFR
jgi:hypothetical protein